MTPTWRLKRRRSSPQAQRFIALRLRDVTLRHPPDAAQGGVVLLVHLDESGAEVGEPVPIVLRPEDVTALEDGHLVTELARLLERDLDVFPEDLAGVSMDGHVPPPREPVPAPPTGPTLGPPGGGLGTLG